MQLAWDLGAITLVTNKVNIVQGHWKFCNNHVIATIQGIF